MKLNKTSYTLDRKAIRDGQIQLINRISEDQADQEPAEYYRELIRLLDYMLTEQE